jgi:hypothetical protein
VARKRMIDPNIWMSEDVGKLNLFERLLLIGMFSNADDEGKGRANPPLIRSLIFPYDDIPIADIEAALEKIKQYIHIEIYEVDGSRYYKFSNWKKWQRVDKIQKSIIPEPPPNDSENDSKNDSKNDSTTSSRMGSDEEKREKEKRKEENIKEDSIREEKETSLSHDKAIEILKFYEGRTCTSIAAHFQLIVSLAEKYLVDDIKEAMEKALDKGKKDKGALDYAQGILKNWQSEGKPTADTSKSNYKVKKPSSWNLQDQRPMEAGLEEKLLKASAGEEPVEDAMEVLRKYREEGK